MFRAVALSILATPALAQVPSTIMVPHYMEPYVAYVGVGGGSYTVNTVPGFISAAEAARIIQPFCAADGTLAHARVEQDTRLVTDGVTGEMLLSRRVTCR